MTKATPISKEAEEVLAQILQNCTNLEKVLQQEQQLLIERNREGWDELIHQKKEIIEALARLEKIWKKSRAGGTFSLSEILEKGEIALSPSLPKIQADFLSLLRRICVLNRENASLLRHALFYNRSFIAMLSGKTDVGTPAVYGPSGKLKESLGNFVGRRI